MRKKTFIAIKIVILISLIQAIVLNGFAQDIVEDTTQSNVYMEADLMKDYQAFKNTSLKIRPPLHFIEFSNEELSGFMNSGTAASIVGFEYDTIPYIGYYDSIAAMTYPKAEHSTYIGSEIVKTDAGFSGQLFFYTFIVDEIDVIRIMFVTGDKKKMIFLQANYPAVYNPLIKRVIIESFLTLEFKQG